VGDIAVRRVDFGYFVRPGSETESGRARVEPVLGYVVDHPAGRLLVDTGMGAHPDVDAHYRPRRQAVDAALADVGLSADDVTVVANCHLHFDHCGGNPGFVGRPVVVQEGELHAATTMSHYTLPELVDVAGMRYEQVTGDAEVFDGVTVVPTPGHTAGHQSVVVRRGDGTVVVVAGQSHDSASQFGYDALAVRSERDGHPGELPVAPGWVQRLLDLDPKRVYFAHDHAVWTPS
jgi:N-acyl homoserine lactone hydrolase